MHLNSPRDLKQMANCLRVLAMDAVQQAKSGHPGLPMGMAEVMTVLYTRFIKHYPLDTDWPNRDRFILSAGHGSMLLYALLYLTGYEDFSIETLKNFRQLHSHAAGHPEYGHGKGIETTTGPLGQGFANAVGMAIAEKHLEAVYGSDLVDHKTYVLIGDGCMMEGISYESAALAGHHKLNKLIALWDNNKITIDGKLSLSSSENSLLRFQAAGWQVLECQGHDFVSIDKALTEAQNSTTHPTLISCETTIAKGAPTKEGTAKAHGSPLGEEEIERTRLNIGWNNPPFSIPEALLNAWRSSASEHQNHYEQWKKTLHSHPFKQEFIRRQNAVLPASFEVKINQIKEETSTNKPTVATRTSSQIVINRLLPELPELMGGSADLTSSNLTRADQQSIFDPTNPKGSYINYGIREHAMAAIMNGLALHKGIIPYAGTFLVFSDYCRPAMRLSALMNLRVIYVMTHDSIGVGEDGPTHQPIETLSALRAIPDLQVMRPCDTVETAECWQLALQNKKNKPYVLALTRQNLPTLRKTHRIENLSRYGAYILNKEKDRLTVTIMASGSEVQLAILAQKQLENQKIGCRVVSAPCLDLYLMQTPAMRQKILGDYQLLASIEAASRQSWLALPERPDVCIGIDTFGASAPATSLFDHFSITVDHLLEQIHQKLKT